MGKLKELSEFVQGAEKKIVWIDVSKPAPVDQATVNVVGAFSVKENIKEQKITKLEDLVGVSESSELYKIVRAIFLGGGQQVVVYGKNVQDDNYGELFNEVKNDWFGTVVDTTDIGAVTAISKEIGAREKMLFAQVPKTTDLESGLTGYGAIAEDTTALFYSRNDEYTAAAVAGYTLSRFPGSTTIGDKKINGAVDSGITGAEQGILEDARINYIAPMKGQLGVFPAVTKSKEPIDFIHCEKALKFRLEEDFTALLKNEDKVGADNLVVIKSTALTRCQQFESRNALVKESTVVTLPAWKDIPANDKLNQVLNGVIVDAYYNYGFTTMGISLKFKV